MTAASRRSNFRKNGHVPRRHRPHENHLKRSDCDVSFPIHEEVDLIMKTSTNIQIVVKDGKSKIAQWTQQFEHCPTVGDRVRIPENMADTLQGYDREATVSLVEMDQNTGNLVISAEAACKLPADQRPLVTLNASLLPQRIHSQVENHLRRRLELPVLEWEESTHTAPIIRLHPFKSQLRTPLETLQSELREILDEAVKLAPC